MHAKYCKQHLAHKENYRIISWFYCCCHYLLCSSLGPLLTSDLYNTEYKKLITESSDCSLFHACSCKLGASWLNSYVSDPGLLMLHLFLELLAFLQSSFSHSMPKGDFAEDINDYIQENSHPTWRNQYMNV